MIYEVTVYGNASVYADVEVDSDEEAIEKAYEEASGFYIGAIDDLTDAEIISRDKQDE
jgi:hypothetical protein